jgi:RimJ/RimL family protein N-acetyltransferase
VNFDLVIARREDNLMVGGIGVHDADQINGTFSYGLGVHPEYKGNGYGAEATVLILRFMFDERRFQKCESHVYDYNSASLALHRKLGFVEEGRLRRHVFQAGECHDEILLGMTVEEFHELYPLLRGKI